MNGSGEKVRARTDGGRSLVRGTPGQKAEEKEREVKSRRGKKKKE